MPHPSVLPRAEKALTEKAYEVIVLEHDAGHSMPTPEMKDVFAWMQAVIEGKKTTLATRRVGDAGKSGNPKKHGPSTPRTRRPTTARGRPSSARATRFVRPSAGLRPRGGPVP